MKNILKKFLITFMVFLIIVTTVTISRAENETSSEGNTSNESNILDEDDNTYSYDDSIELHSNKEYSDSLGNYDSNATDLDRTIFSITSKDITLSKDIQGDVFICTAGKLTIDCSVSGNVFACATDVEISNNGEISSSLFTTSNTLNVLGNINGNIYSVCKDFTLNNSASLNQELFLSAENANIKGSIYRDAYILSENLTFDDNASIEGDLNYSSNTKINGNIDDIVNGNVNVYDFSNKQNNVDLISGWIYSLVSYIILTIVLFAICKFMKCKFIDMYPDFIANMPKYLLYGLLALIITPIASIVLLTLGFTANIALLLIAVYIMLMLISSSIAIIIISELCSDKLKEKFKVNDTLRTIISIIVLCIAYKLLQLVSIIGFIITFALVLIGLGLLIKRVEK